MKGAGMLVISLRSVNFGFWSHLGCPGKNANIFSRKGVDNYDLYYFKDKGSIKITSKLEAFGRTLFSGAIG